MLTPIMAMVKEVRNSGQALQHLCGAGEEQQSLRGTGGVPCLTQVPGLL